VAYWSDCNVLNTVTEDVGRYTKDEEKQVMEAEEIIQNSGYPSLDEARHLTLDGIIQNIPNQVGVDFERSIQVYGLYPEYVKGKLTRKVVPRAKVDTKTNNK
jgi:hypothetical protein